MKSLFLCFTPLQVMIARSIILSENYSKDDVELYVFALSDSKRYLYYYDLVKPLCAKVWFVTELPSFPLYLKWIKANFKAKKYEDIFLASIDSVFCQYILSFSEFNQLKTFDDGTANILPSSIYYNELVDLKFKTKKIIWRFFGNKYCRKKLIDKSVLHYTLYPGFENIISNLRIVSLFPEVIQASESKNNKKISVFLGTVFKDVLKNGISDTDRLVKSLQLYLDSVEGDIIYFPHPRDETDYFPELPRNDSSLVAEESIVELFKEYEEVELIGFASSTQFNLMAQPKITNVVLDSELLTLIMRDLIKVLSEKGVSLFVIDNN